jgi:hypothetical protein
MDKIAESLRKRNGRDEDRYRVVRLLNAAPCSVRLPDGSQCACDAYTIVLLPQTQAAAVYVAGCWWAMPICDRCAQLRGPSGS